MVEGPRLDLHVHTRASPDSSLSVEDVLRDALVQGLQGVAITDHNSTAAWTAARQAFRGTRSFLFVPGVEVSTREGHLLVYGVDHAPVPHRPIRRTVEEVIARGGVPVLAHPLRWAHGAGAAAARKLPVLGIEAMNGRNAAVPNARAGVIASERRIAATGGSDAHERGSVGRCFTVCEEEVATVEEVLELLRRGRVHADGKSQGLAGRVGISLLNALKRGVRGGSEV